MKITLHSLSSDGKMQYPVEFTYLDETLTVQCGCQAGIFHKYCKRVALFLSGDGKLLCNSAQAPELKLVTSWAKAAGFDQRFAEVAKAEAEIERAQKAVKKMKEALWAALYKDKGLAR